MDLGLADRSVLVLAGSRGIGLAIARGYDREGAQVTICGRDPAALDAAAAAMPRVFAVPGDVTVATDLERIVAAATDRFGAPEILVVNAGGPPGGLAETLDDAAWGKAVELTLMSAVRAARLVLPAMRARKWGRIVIVSSFGVKQPVAGLTLSNSIRLAVLGWAKTLARQVAGDGIPVNTVCPGWTRTDRITALIGDDAAAAARIAATIPLGRIGEPDEIASLAVFLGSAAASYITGTAIQVDGGVVEGY